MVPIVYAQDVLYEVRKAMRALRRLELLCVQRVRKEKYAAKKRAESKPGKASA